MLEQKINPMEPQSVKMLREKPGYAYQVKWDGVRLLAFVEEKKVCLRGKSLKDKSAFYPELTALPELLHGRSAILDGEIIALHDALPSFYRVMRREGAGTGFSAAWLAKRIPIYYMVFDLLFYNETWLLEQPWEARQEMIWRHISAGEHLLLTPAYERGEALLKTVQEKGMEGVVAKKRDSPYVPGPRRSSYWQKTKVEQTLETYVGGIMLRGQRPASLLLGLEDEGMNDDCHSSPVLRYIGNVSSGLSVEDMAIWQERASEHECPESPFLNFKPSPGKEYLFIKPAQKIRVAFHEWTPTLKLRAPRFMHDLGGG